MGAGLRGAALLVVGEQLPAAGLALVRMTPRR